MPDHLQLADWLDWLRETASPERLELLALQVGAIVAAFVLATGFRAVTRRFTDPLVHRIARSLPAAWMPGAQSTHESHKLTLLAYAWLLLVVAARVADSFWLDFRLVSIAATLAALWIVLRASTLLLRDALMARLVALAAWTIAALDITGLLGPTVGALDSFSLTVGTVRLSLLLVLKAALLIAILLWAALAVARLLGSRVQMVTGLSPSLQILTVNMIKIVLVSLALLIALNTVGIDLTAFAVFSGAVGVGLGFGLQKIVSNFVSGIILLVEQSIKPGDVIQVGHTYGSITALGARFASVRGRDGKEYLIPNETLITNEVTNLSYTSPLLRLDLTFGVGYDSDPHEVRRLAIEAALGTGRVIGTPTPVCHITEFGDNGINLLLRFWIDDPENGVRNVTGDVYLALWDRFREHGIELPFPQREIRFRDTAAAFVRPDATREAADWGASKRGTAQAQRVADDGDR